MNEAEFWYLVVIFIFAAIAAWIVIWDAIDDARKKKKEGSHG